MCLARVTARTDGARRGRAAPGGTAGAAARRRAACGETYGSPCFVSPVLLSPGASFLRVLSPRIARRLQAVGHIRFLAGQLDAGRLRLEHHQRREILLPVPAADETLHDL